MRKLKHIRKLIMLLALLAPVSVWGQTDLSGVYYIGSRDYNAGSPSTNYYLCPTELWYFYKATNDYAESDNGMPFLTTYKFKADGTYDGSKAIWILEKHPTKANCYYVIQNKTGRYMVSNGQIRTSTNANRMRVHLEYVADAAALEALGDLALFEIRDTTVSSASSKYIRPHSAAGRNGDNAFLVVNNNNSNYLKANPSGSKKDGPNGSYGRVNDGVIGLYTWEDNARFYLEDARCATPTISFNNATGEVTIETATAGATIYYTTDNSIPDTANVGGINPTQQYNSADKPTVSTEKTIKAIAVEASHANSLLASLSITQVATPAVEDNGENSIILTCDTEGATIYYTLDPSEEPATEYTPGTLLREGFSNRTIRMIAKKSGLINSAIGTGSVKLKCDPPIINQEEGKTFTLTATFPLSGVMKYSINDENGTYSTYGGSAVSFSNYGDVVYAKTTHADYYESDVTSLEMVKDLEGEGTAESPYLITSQAEFVLFVSWINNKAAKRSAYYELQTDVSGASAITQPFSGTFDGAGYTITGLTHSLFNTVNGGTVKNLMLDNVSISGGTNVGAICNEATGDSRIYNCGVLATNSAVEKDDDGYDHISSCSSTISGSNYVGGLVGLLDGSSRVINCFSYANITAGAEVGGIVGHNNVVTNANSGDADHYLKTMVMNCMFYGEVSGTSIAPIYNGEIISNVDNYGVSNFNYFRLESAYIQNTDLTKVYHCALGAETRFLQRFEFFRHLLNSHRELAAWWATGNAANKDEMMKWVMIPDSIGTSTPYPILKTPGKYPSVVNIDATNAEENQPRNQGGKLGTLAVTIRMGSGGAVYGPPAGASITNSDTILIITDKDTAHFNYNYYKVQLPYYNDVGTKNYNSNRVVTGWKIVSITGGTAGTYSTGEDVTYDGSGNLTATPYNFADRNCTAKDLYGGETAADHSGRVFNQGAYWDVPYGVTAITIEPYWAKCVYLADSSADMVYNLAMTTGYAVPNVGGGKIYTNGNSYSIAGESQMVFTDKGKAIASSNSGLFHGVTGTPGDQTVYDYAVVLVGNYHFYGSLDADKSKPYTVTSVDLDGDNEPDYSYILRFNSRVKVHPVRVDFINIPGLGMAQKSTGGTGTYNFGIMQPLGWFESTNTSLFRVTQFEYDCNNSGNVRGAAPYILQGGVMEQWVLGQNQGRANNTTYFHVGGNVWFKEFHRGTHQDENYSAKHPPVSVTGGDFDQFHLTGLYKASADIFDDNAECYITGGRFRVVAGTGMDGIGHPTNHTNGNITWIIDNADIREFYAGSFNADKPAQGKLHTIINGGHIDFFCGGPKFGDMNSGRTVITTATGCTFGTFFGAGYGGSSYSRQAPYNANNQTNIVWNDWIKGNTTYGDPGQGDNPTFNGYKRDYNSAFGGVSTQFSYQFIPMSGNTLNCARLWIEFVKFSLATTHNVTSTLKHCTIENNFYGGGSLGKVDGTVTSVLDSCTVYGNVFGAGFSASLPTVEVDSIGGFRTEPYYYSDLGTYRTAVKGSTITYTWAQNVSGTRIEDAADDAARTELAVDQEKKILYTDENLSKSNLGSVSTAILTLKGNTTVGTQNDATTGNVYGGGDESTVSGDTQVILKDGATVLGNVYGGGNNGTVGGNSSVTIQD